MEEEEGWRKEEKGEILLLPLRLGGWERGRRRGRKGGGGGGGKERVWYRAYRSGWG